MGPGVVLEQPLRSLVNVRGQNRSKKEMEKDRFSVLVPLWLLFFHLNGQVRSGPAIPAPPFCTWALYGFALPTVDCMLVDAV